MANTYTQIHIQAIFAVQNRESVIRIGWKDDLYKYISGIIQNQEKHHKKWTFKEEYLDFLQKFELEYDERYILKSVEYDVE
jgi:putative transposase